MQEKSSIRKFISICIAIVVVACLFITITHSVLKEWNISGTFGDTFGALNTLFSGFAFAGIIISILQQQEDTKSVRKENEIQRVIDTISKQTERADEAITTFSVQKMGKLHHGYDAFSQLKDAVRIYYPILTEKLPEDQARQVRQQINKENISIYSENKNSITNLSIRLYNATNVFKAILLNSALNPEEMNFYKKMYFDHIGFIIMGELEKVENNFQDAIKLFNEDSNYISDFTEISRAHIFLQSILKFYNANFTAKNFEEVKRELLQ